MLVLSRKKDETIRIIVPPSDRPMVIDIMAVEIRGDKTRIGVQAEREVMVHRREVFDAIARGEVKNVPRSQRDVIRIGDLLPGEIVRTQ